MSHKRLLHLLGNHELVAGMVIFVGSTTGFSHTFTMYPEAALFPRFILGLMAFLALGLVVQGYQKHNPEESRKPFFIHLPRLVLIIGLMLAYMFTVSWLGYYSSTVIFLPGTAFAIGLRRLSYLIISTILYLLFVFLVFNLLFSLPFPAELFQR